MIKINREQAANWLRLSEEREREWLGALVVFGRENTIEKRAFPTADG